MWKKFAILNQLFVAFCSIRKLQLQNSEIVHVNCYKICPQKLLTKLFIWLLTYDLINNVWIMTSNHFIAIENEHKNACKKELKLDYANLWNNFFQRFSRDSKKVFYSSETVCIKAEMRCQFTSIHKFIYLSVAYCLSFIVNY